MKYSAYIEKENIKNKIDAKKQTFAHVKSSLTSEYAAKVPKIHKGGKKNPRMKNQNDKGRLQGLFQGLATTSIS